MAEPIDLRASIDSHTDTDFGKYDVEPYPVSGNAYYWYQRAVYWKREANRKEGIQQTMEFKEKSVQHPNGSIVLSPSHSQVVKYYILSGFQINAIKAVRDFTMCGLKEAKDYCDILRSELQATGAMSKSNGV